MGEMNSFSKIKHLWGAFVTLNLHLLHIQILEILGINEWPVLLNKTYLFLKVWFAGPGFFFFNTKDNCNAT